MIQFDLRICFQMGWLHAKPESHGSWMDYWEGWLFCFMPSRKNGPSKSPGLSSMIDRHLEHMTCDVFLGRFVGKVSLLLGVRILCLDWCFSFQAYCCCWIYPYQPRMLARWNFERFRLGFMSSFSGVEVNSHPGWMGWTQPPNIFKSLHLIKNWIFNGKFGDLLKTSISSCRVFI